MAPDQSSNSNINLILVIALVIAAGLAGYFYSQAKLAGLAGKENKPSQQVKTDSKTIDNPKFIACLDSGKYTPKVKAQYDEAVNAGINSTPTTVVVDTKTNRRFAIIGAQAYETVKSNLDRFMSGEEIKIETAPGRLPPKLEDIPGPSPDKDHWRGDKTARYVLIEYSDLECPFCRRFHATMQQILDDYSQQVAWVYRHLPLTSIHPRAQLEAEASECAVELGGKEAFWSFVDTVFERTKSNGLSFDKKDLASLAAELGIK